MNIELDPWMVPNFVSAKMPVRPRQDGFVELPKWALSEVDATDLAQLCDQFRAEVFCKAGKTDPVQTAVNGKADGTIGPSLQKICLWTEDDDRTWHTACNQAFTLFDGTPAENHYVYCPHCGQKILERPVDVFDERGE